MDQLIKKRQIFEQTWIAMLILILAAGIRQMLGSGTGFSFLMSSVIVLVPLTVMAFRLLRIMRVEKKDVVAELYHMKCCRSAKYMVIFTSGLLIANMFIKLITAIWHDGFVEFFALLVLPMLFYTMEIAFFFAREEKDVKNLFCLTGLGLFVSALIMFVRLYAAGFESFIITVDGQVLADFLLAVTPAVFTVSFIWCFTEFMISRLKKFFDRDKTLAKNM